ncbi:MAG TPA: 3D domain-containing protein [Pyrinomonadaceae bacterium]|nr:3D domain-containing protein [Pyrinomonadaceae bacterium]
MKVNSIFSGSALIGAALLTSSLILPATTSSAETLSFQTQQQKSIAEASNPVTLDVTSTGNLGDKLAAEEAYVVPPTAYVATAYSLRGRTASGRMVSKGLIAADPRHLPLGSRVRIDAGAYSGEYLVADTGGMVRGRRIDIWTPTAREAMRFGRRTVKLTVLSLGGRRKK